MSVSAGQTYVHTLHAYVSTSEKMERVWQMKWMSLLYCILEMPEFSLILYHYNMIYCVEFEHFQDPGERNVTKWTFRKLENEPEFAKKQNMRIVKDASNF